MTDFPQIIVGTYEEFLLGYEIEKNNDGKFQLLLNMASHAHQGSIRCVASHRHLLASSGADEYVNIFTMVNRQEVAVLTPHAGTVTSLAFAPDGSHLISGSQDGSIVIFRCSDWTMMKIWKDAHKKANGVLELSVHPSGKLLLSIGADNILRVWNLVKGRLAYAVNFNKRISPGNTLNLVTWSGDGSHYAIAIGTSADIYNTESAAVVYSIKCSSRISCFDLSQEGLIIIGCDDGTMEIHSLGKKEQILEHKGHEKRIKCIRSFQMNEKEDFVVSADSQGVLRLWSWKRHRQIKKLNLETEINSDCRIVCLTMINPSDFVKKEDDVENSTEKSQTKEQAVVTPTNGTKKKKKLSKEEKTPECVEIEDESSPSPRVTKSKKRKSSSTNKTSETTSSSNFTVTPVKQSKSKRKSFSTSQWDVSNVK